MPLDFFCQAAFFYIQAIKNDNYAQIQISKIKNPDL